jgi:hypothetical protein
MHVQSAGGTPLAQHMAHNQKRMDSVLTHMKILTRALFCVVFPTRIHSTHCSLTTQRGHVTPDPSNPLPQCHTSGFGILFSTDWECSAYADSVRKARAHPPSEGFALAHAAAEGHSSEGWGIFDPMAEYERLGLPDSKWRLSTVNENYSVCPR